MIINDPQSTPAAYPTSNGVNRNFSILPDEQIVMTLHKHWFVLFRNAGGTGIIGIIVSIGASALFGVLGNTSTEASALFLFASAAWLLFIWFSLAIIWTNHYLDMWIITDQRVIHVEQVRLFVREVTTLHLERIQDATVLLNGFVETMLDFGTIHVESAGADVMEVTMHGMPQPEKTKQVILELVDKFRSEHVWREQKEEGDEQRQQG